MHRTTKIGLFSLVDHLPDPVTGNQLTQTQRLLNVIELGQLAEKAGFERFAVGEHHFSKYILSNPILALAAIATKTQRIKLFTTVTLLAYRDTIQLVEDINLLDHLSGGRLELSFARGVSYEAGAHFGVTPDNVYDLMREKLEELIHSLTSGETVSSEENHREKMTISPESLQQPHAPLWIGGGLSGKSSALAVKHNLPLVLPSLFKFPEDYLPFVAAYRAGIAEKHGEQNATLAFPSYCWVAKTSQEAKKQWRPRLENYVSYAQKLRKGFNRPLDFETLIKGPAICGSPAEVTDRINEINETLGLSHQILIMDVGGMPQNELMDSLELMSTEVLPHFNG